MSGLVSAAVGRKRCREVARQLDEMVERGEDLVAFIGRQHNIEFFVDGSLDITTGGRFRIEGAPRTFVSSRDVVVPTRDGLVGVIMDETTEEALERAFHVLRRIGSAAAEKASPEDRRPRFGEAVIDENRFEVVQPSGKSVKLTLRETMMLVHFSRNPRQFFSRGELVDRFWGADVKPATVIDALKTQMSALRRKLGTSGRCLCCRTGIGYGYVPD